MKPIEEYEFHLEAYTPATIPMERLAKYLAVLAELFGNEKQVHFDRLKGGSTSPVVRVDKEAAVEVEERLSVLITENAANDDVAIFHEINKLCTADNAKAQLFRMVKGERAGELLSFPGVDDAPNPYSAVDGPFSVDGELIRIGGKDLTAHAMIKDADGRVWSGVVTREMARDIVQYLYAGEIRATGTAKWMRTKDGKWEKKGIKFNSVDFLEDESLSAVRTRLMALKDSDWKNVKDINKTISKERG